MKSRWLGLCPYHEALELQNRQARSNDNMILGCEHPAVITLGRRARPEAEIVELNTLPVITTDRGGLATLHSPGQLVIYPILSLRESQLGVREYVEKLLQTTQRWLKTYQVESFYNMQTPGLYTARGKIAFVGLRVQNGRTRHGLSINVRNDLALFQTIRACGHTHQRFDQLGGTVALNQLFESWVELFCL